MPYATQLHPPSLFLTPASESGILAEYGKSHVTALRILSSVQRVSAIADRMNIRGIYRHLLSCLPWQANIRVLHLHDRYHLPSDLSGLISQRKSQQYKPM